MTIIIPGSEKPDDAKIEEQTKGLIEEYDATEEDEEQFFLMYHMHIQPSEAAALSSSYRRWIIGRFMAQKQMEREMMQQQRLMQTLPSNLKVQ